jgi:4-hydroxybenzoate polyprenyltransferase
VKNTLFRASLNAVQLMRMHKPIGFWLLLWPALMGLWLASQQWPAYKLILIYIAGAFIMRSVGCVINDLADKNFDAKVTRTKSRPLAARLASTGFACGLVIILLSCALALFLQLNSYAKIHALIALALACCYPLFKRFFHAPQLVLGLAFAWSIPLAFAQIRHSVNYRECWLLFASIVAWVIAYDTQYALTDRNDDLKIGIKSSAIFFGVYVEKIILLLQCLAVSLLMVLGILQHYSWIFFIGMLLSLGLFIEQDYLVKKQQYLAAFNKNNLLGLTWFILIILGTYFKV